MIEPLDLLLLLPRHDDGVPHHPDGALQVLGITIITAVTALATILCGLRLYSRSTTKALGYDDWIILAVTVLTINQCWASNLFVHHDKPARMYEWLSLVFYTPILGLVKISWLILLLRLGGKQTNGVRVAIHSLIALVAALVVATELVVVIQCTPPRLAWTMSFVDRPTHGRCVDAAVFTLTSAAVNIFTDLLVLVLPYCIFLDIKINKRMRNTLIGVFMLGTAVTVCSVVRLYYAYKIFYVPSDDETHSIGFILSAVESNVAIVAASVPAVWPLARRCFPSLDEKLGVNRAHQADIEVMQEEEVACCADGSCGPTSPPKVKITWRRTNPGAMASETSNLSLRREKHEQQLRFSQNSKTMSTETPPFTPGWSSSGGGGGGGQSEGNSQDGLLPAGTSSVTSPLSRNACGEEDEPKDYFGDLSAVAALVSAGTGAESPPESGGHYRMDRDSYHGVIATRGHTSPYGNHHRHYAHDDDVRAYMNSTPDRPALNIESVDYDGNAMAAHSLPTLPHPAVFRLTMPQRSRSSPSGGAFKLALPPSKMKTAAAVVPTTTAAAAATAPSALIPKLPPQRKGVVGIPTTATITEAAAALATEPPTFKLAPPPKKKTVAALPSPTAATTAAGPATAPFALTLRPHKRKTGGGSSDGYGGTGACVGNEKKSS